VPAVLTTTSAAVTSSGAASPRAFAVTGPAAYPSGIAASEASQSYDVTRASRSAGMCRWTAVSQTGLRKPRPTIAAVYAVSSAGAGAATASRSSGTP
jgi:hypothetical protein